MKKPEPLQSGLYLVATPIGNLRDMTLRALDVLAAADLILCEDTRVTRKLLHAYDITTPLRCYNDHSTSKERAMFAKKIEEGQAIALVSDAGMPLVSDPGYKLLQQCKEQGLYVTTIPGANAPLCALQLSGMPPDAFCFLGFMPPKRTARRQMLEEWAQVRASLIAFETVPRLLDALDDINTILGARSVCVVREITKRHEEVRCGVPNALIEYYQANGLPKGELVLVIAPPGQKTYDIEEIRRMLSDLLPTMSVKESAGHLAKQTGWKKSQLYDMALEVKKGHDSE